MMFKGCFVALVTPFVKGEIDEENFRGLIQFQLEKGIDGIVPCGTTGESPTLSYEEHKRLIRITVEEVKGKVPVIAGTGSNSTTEAEELTIYAKEVGADAALVITPYYNKPTQSGMEKHYQKLAKIGFPIIIYNVPSRTGVNILPSTVEKLSKLKSIVGIKEASGDMDQISEIISSCSSEFSVLSGNDSHTLPILSLGGVGVISVLANILPQETTQLVKAWLEGEIERAKELHYKLLPLFKAMFIETNPIPVKTAMAKLRMISKEWRLPLGEMKEENEKKLDKILNKYGLI
ncbi:4-hydroxy-tetrahydrodipicolinate synthase [Candidatus Aerophobetes bacterium]|nr:4-hydroxy-tetrahydrodipicolinate synthase [Candidatus Aerophobetes bacterium]